MAFPLGMCLKSNQEAVGCLWPNQPCVTSQMSTVGQFCSQHGFLRAELGTALLPSTLPCISGTVKASQRERNFLFRESLLSVFCVFSVWLISVFCVYNVWLDFCVLCLQCVDGFLYSVSIVCGWISKFFVYSVWLDFCVLYVQCVAGIFSNKFIPSSPGGQPITVTTSCIVY